MRNKIILLVFITMAYGVKSQIDDCSCPDSLFSPPKGYVFKMEWPDSLISIREPELVSGEGITWFFDFLKNVKLAGYPVDCQNESVYVAVLYDKYGSVQDYKVYMSSAPQECEEFICSLLEKMPDLIPAKAIYKNSTENVPYELMLPFRW